MTSPVRSEQSAIRPSPIFVAVLLVTIVFGYLCVNPYLFGTGFKSSWAVFGFVTSGWVLSLIAHEFAHAFVAYLGGDKSVVEKGYLTLNPIKYAHPFLSVVIPVAILAYGGIGLPGGAVFIDHRNLSPRQQSFVSAAGPFASLLFGILLLAPLTIGLVSAEPLSIEALETLNGWGVLGYAMAFLGGIQLLAFVLNMLPIPPLDGFGILEPMLPKHIQTMLQPISRYGFFILLMLFFYSPFGEFLWTFLYNSLEVIGVNQDAFLLGYDCYRFWTSEPGLICDISDQVANAAS